MNLLSLAIQIQQIPAPTFAEGKRAQFVRGLFTQENLSDVEIDSVGNVYARMAGKDGGAPLVVSAHLDTVFSDGTNLQVKQEAGKVFAAGIGDNSLGVAALFGIIDSLRKNKIKLARDIWFVANVGEEGLGDLVGMKAVVDRFGADVKCYLVLEGMALGHIYHQAIGVRRYRITAKTVGGHSWSDYGNPSAVHELAGLVTRFAALKLPRTPRTTLNVGKLHGGTGINVLASDATLELDLRSEDHTALTNLIHDVEALVHSAEKHDVKMEMEMIGSRPAGVLDANHELIQLALKCAREFEIDSTLTSGSTDANIPLSLGYPALVLGITIGGGAHTLQEYIDVEPLENGIKMVSRFVEAVGGG